MRLGYLPPGLSKTVSEVADTQYAQMFSVSASFSTQPQFSVWLLLFFGTSAYFLHTYPMLDAALLAMN
jgi:hypothetical protein